MNFTEMSAHYAAETDRQTNAIYHRLRAAGASDESAREQSEYFRDYREGEGWQTIIEVCRVASGQPLHPPSDSIH